MEGQMKIVILKCSSGCCPVPYARTHNCFFLPQDSWMCQIMRYVTSESLCFSCCLFYR